MIVFSTVFRSGGLGAKAEHFLRNRDLHCYQEAITMKKRLVNTITNAY